MIRRTPLQRGIRGLRPVSIKRAKLNKIYSALRKKFLAEHPLCEFWMAENPTKLTFFRCGLEGLRYGNDIPCPRSTDVHHKKGRGKYLLDVSTWMAVSREGHDWIHAHPKESEERGYIIRR